jgi:molecular chaperone DnaK
MPQIEVTFDIAANGIVNVSAKDRGTGKEQRITITTSSGLSKDEVDRMMKDAEAHAEEDKKRREEIETRNRADQSVYAAEKLLQDAGDKVGADARASVQSAIDALKSAISANDVAAMNTAMEQLTQAQHKVAEALYSQAGAAPGGPGGGPGASAGAGSGGGDAAGGGSRPAEGDVIDAEVVDEK